MTFVLIHGAWHGGWCWRRVAWGLRQAGHDVFAPSLTGLGDRSHLLSPDVNLSTHIADIANILAWHDLENVILCGHSYGGLLTSAVADRMRERIRGLVYLDALLPSDGDCMFDLIPSDIAEGFRNQALAGDGFSVPPMTAEQFNVNATDAAWMDRKCTNHPLASFEEPVALSGRHTEVPERVYLLAAGFDHPGTRRAYELVDGDAGWTTAILAGGHDLMIDNPDAVIQHLLTLVEPAGQ